MNNDKATESAEHTPGPAPVNVEEIVREVMLAYPYTNYQYVAQNAAVEADRANRHARSVAGCVGRRVAASTKSGSIS